ncbi:hypothetical protein HCN44_002064 [Aphidius gifuensis]|uniref:Uncharacterized protein n=1 Tax=Aphidius gifuensis TaxID=684658 RepID=A0A834Y2I0_APHGI|nr:hypothetical protein HCN44_002064 [Aphidius gifuensis]
MSGILRNTLRLVGTAKYAPNNSTKYLRSMTFTTNHLNNSLSLLQPNYLNHNRFGTQAKKISTDNGTTIWATGKKILSLFDANEEIKKNANIVHLKVSLSSGKVRLLTPEEEKYLIFPPKFSIKVNEESIDPSNNNIDAKPVTLSFYLGKWHVTLDDDELTLKIRDTGEIFILRHEVYVKALIKPPKQLEDGTYQMVPDPPISDYGVCGAKIISKQAGLEPFERSFAPRQTKATAEILKSYGNPISEALIDTKSARIIDDTPNSFGRMKLKFPMTVSLEGAPLQIKIKNSDDM